MAADRRGGSWGCRTAARSAACAVHLCRVHGCQAIAAVNPAAGSRQAPRAAAWPSSDPPRWGLYRLLPKPARHTLAAYAALGLRGRSCDRRPADRRGRLPRPWPGRSWRPAAPAARTWSVDWASAGEPFQQVAFAPDRFEPEHADAFA